MIVQDLQLGRVYVGNNGGFRCFEAIEGRGKTARFRTVGAQRPGRMRLELFALWASRPLNESLATALLRDCRNHA